MSTLLSHSSFPWSSLPEFSVTSETFEQGQVLPAPLLSKEFGVPGGEDISPQLSWEGYPAETRSFAVTAYDPDAPTGSGFWHWAVANIPVEVTSLAQGAGTPGSSALPESAITLPNDAGIAGFLGAAPPPGHGPHHYVFTVFAVDTPVLEIPTTATPAFLGFNLYSHAIGYAQISGQFAQLS